MPQRRPSLLVPTVVAAAALVLGSVGTAVAGPSLTQGQVKKIAAKVVVSRAGGLSVARAQTATTAESATTARTATTAQSAATAATAGDTSRLAGLPASAYRTAVWTFQLPKSDAATGSRSWTFDVPPGTYQVSYDVFLVLDQINGAADCGLYVSGTSGQRLGWAYGAAYSNFLTNTGSTVLEVGAADPKLQCGASRPWGVGDPGVFAPSQVVFTRVDDLTAGTVSVPTVAAPPQAGSASPR